MQQNARHGFIRKTLITLRNRRNDELYLCICFVCILVVVSLFMLSTSDTKLMDYPSMKISRNVNLLMLSKYLNFSYYTTTNKSVLHTDSTKKSLSAIHITKRPIIEPLKVNPLQYKASLNSSLESLKNEINIAFPNGGKNSVEFQNIYKKCHENDKGNYIPGYDKPVFLIDEKAACLGEIYLVIAVHSNSPNQNRRNLIRSSWASVRHVNLRRIVVMFFVGVTNNPKDQLLINEESEYYHDIIQRNFTEHYRNITYKHITVLRWVTEHCLNAKFILKCDDDTFIDVFHAVRFLEVSSTDGFICKIVGGKPIRNPKSNMRKWLVTKEEYPKERYPKYCEGFAYFLKVKHVKSLYWCSIFSKIFWIDDVHITGTLRNKLDIPIDYFWHGHSWDNMIPSYASEKITDVIFLLASHNEVMPEFWKRLWKAVLKYNLI